MPPRHGGPADGHPPGAIPGNRTNPFAICDSTGCASARGRVSKTQLTPGGTEAACQIANIANQKFFMGAWQKSDAPALQAGSSRSVTGRPPPVHCGENEIQAGLITSASVGATPTPATKGSDPAAGL